MSFSLNDKHIAIHYHYIEDPNPHTMGMNPCSVADFEQQIKFLSEHYRLTTIDEVFNAARDKKEEKICALTFDDGYKDQYKNAVPILKKYNAQGTFFIITQTSAGILPYAHKVHIALSRLSPFEVIDAWNIFLAEKYPGLAERFFIPKDRRLVPDRRLYADVPSANIKEVFSAAGDDVRDAFLDSVFKQQHLNEKDLCQEMFMDTEEIRNLERDGFVIGNHTHSHRALSYLTEAQARDDFQRARVWFTKILKSQPTLFSYPYGLVPKWPEDFLLKEGIDYAVTVEDRPIAASDKPLLVPRYDMVWVRDFLKK